MNSRAISHKAIILSAGQGSRLLPMTQDTPKCLLDLSGRSMLEWQLRALSQAGVLEAVVVTGFRAEKVEAELARIAPPGMRVTTFFNPFYKLADNLASCWMVRHEMAGPNTSPASGGGKVGGQFLILNGDTLLGPEIVRRLLSAPPAAITVTIDRKPAYDADDMKVSTMDDRLLAIGKKLSAAETTGESIGFLRFESAGAAAFVAEIERTMRTPEGPGLWYLSAIHRLANAGVDVHVASIEGQAWGELDFPADLVKTREIAAAWGVVEQRATAEA